jgi:uncharacterized protein YutE (UPF0331/DUF86 family)
MVGNKMLNAYSASMQDHIQQLVSQLDQLASIDRSLNQFESLAAERLLQVLIEACIGISKHWVKHQGLGIASDANSAFILLDQSGQWTNKELDWRKIIGLRNALVHDYLNIDQQVILDVVNKRRYKALAEFAFKGLKVLSSPRFKTDKGEGK